MCDIVKNIPKLSADNVKDCVVAYLNGNVETIVVKDYDIKSASDGLAGFQGEHYKMTVNAIVDDSEREFNFFIKSLPHDVDKANKMNEAGYFRREVAVYKDIFSQLEKKDDKSAFHPMYLISTECDIVLEDLSKKGFIITDQRKTFDYKHCIVALMTLARFHAASLILESNAGYKIETKFRDVLDECGYKFNGWYAAGFEAVLEIINETNIDMNNVDVSVFKKTCCKMYREVLDLCCPSKTSPNVLSHRDLWANNLMFRYNVDGEPEQCVFVDYQACRCMPPAGDVMSLLCLNTTKDDRNDNLEIYLHYYYSILSRELKENNIDIDELLPWNEFRSDCETYRKWALGQSTILLQMALLEKDYAEKLLENPCDYERIINVSRKDIVLKMIREDQIYRERLIPLVEEFILNYVINQ